jgi:ABC-type Fe3+-siderophore transport system permease subunit
MKNVKSKFILAVILLLVFLILYGIRPFGQWLTFFSTIGMLVALFFIVIISFKDEED